MGFIYKITNLVNNKIYIGKTTFTIESRWNRHCYEVYRNRLQYSLYKAMRKYGIENFTIVKIEEVPDDLLNEREKYWIEYYNSYITNGLGYNETLGGEGNTKINRETVYWLWDNGLSIQQIAKELGNDRSSIRKILQAYENYSVEESNRRGDAFQSNNRWKRVNQYSLSGVLLNTYNNSHEAERQTGISNKNIHNALNHKQKTAGGFQWRYEDDTQEVENISDKNRISKEVLQIKDNEIIAIYKTAAEASRQTGINSGQIRLVCQNKAKTAGGFEWKYKGE